MKRADQPDALYRRFSDRLDRRFNSRPRPDDLAVVALSGGADSTALLLLLNQRRREIPFDLRAVHIDHQHRGAESDADRRFCENLCERLNVPLTVKRISDAGESLDASVKRNGAEAAWRTARIVILHSVAGSTEMPADRIGIWFAHHSDDQAETVLIRALRGGSVESLAGMDDMTIWPDGVRHCRPLLEFRKQELIDWLKSNGEPWATDSTNANPDDNLRAALRLRVLPEINAAFGRDALPTLALLADRVREWNQALPPPPERLLLPGNANELNLDNNILRAAPEPLALRWVLNALKTWLRQSEPVGDDAIGDDCVSGIRELIRAGSETALNALNVNDRIIIRREPDRLRIILDPLSAPPRTAPSKSNRNAHDEFAVEPGTDGVVWAREGVGTVSAATVSLEDVLPQSRPSLIKNLLGESRQTAVFDIEGLDGQPLSILSKRQFPAPQPPLPRALKTGCVPAALRADFPVLYIGSETEPPSPAWIPWAFRDSRALVNDSTLRVWRLTFAMDFR